MTAPAPPFAPVYGADQPQYYASLFLSPAQRAALNAFHAYCQEVAGITHAVHDPGVAQAKLNWWRQQVGQNWNEPSRRPDHPLLQALQPHAQPYGIATHHLLQVIDGYQMDLDQSRYLDYANLQQYCQRVAGTVTEVSARIYGQSTDGTTQHAQRLGLAIQLTQLLRNLGRDAARGRIYLPINDLQQFDVKAHELVRRGQSSDASFPARFEALLRFQITRTEQTLDEALDLLPSADRRSQKPGLILASMHRTLLREIAAAPHQVLTEQIHLTPLRMLWLSWKVQALGRL